MWSQIALSFGAGALAVISPCTFPILPGIVGALTDGMRDGIRVRGVLKIILFAFGAAVALIGAVALLLIAGVYVNLLAPPASLALGAVFILMALSSAGIVRLPTASPRISSSLGWAKPIVMGFVLALAWVPCIGPSLGVALTLGSQSKTVAHGLLLAVCFFIGLAVPIFIFGVLAMRIGRGRKWTARVGRVFNYVLAMVMALIGVLLITGLWTNFSTWIVSVTPSFLYVL
jgi:cytochrome c-type biogenesis protein